MIVDSEDEAASSSVNVAQASSLLGERHRNLDGCATIAVKVIDFGVAEAIAEQPDAMSLTRAGFVGTPAFASPEQFTGGTIDGRSDNYSLGATLCFLLTGKMPFRGPDRGRDSQQAGVSRSAN